MGCLILNLGLLETKINLIQEEYKNLLITLLPRLKSSMSKEALDDINLFWIKHMDAVELYLQAIFAGEESYVFTASTYMDYDDQEYVPFLLLGKKHILDDPLGKYSEICNAMPNGKDNHYLYTQIGITAEDNLKILSNLQEHVLILPLRLLDQTSANNELFDLGKAIFINLFKDVDSLDDYFVKCKSISEIEHYLREDAAQAIMFSEDDDKTLPFAQRFKMALADRDYMVDTKKTDAYNFFVLVFGCIQQSVDIIASCTNYKCVPFIRYPVSLHYVSILVENMKDDVHIRILGFKMSVAFIVYKLCDKKRINTTDLNSFLTKNQGYNFSDKLYYTLSARGINENNFTNYPIRQLVVEELEKYYDWMETM